MWIRILVFGIGLCLPSLVFGNDTLKTTVPFTVAPATGVIELDGNPSEADWEKAPSLNFFVLEPVWGSAPVERTEMKFLYDRDHLYVAGKCFYKDPSKIVARNFVKDGWRGDDWVAVHIDSRFDHRTAINFAIYPAGSRYDMLISNDAVELGSSATNSSFNAIWDARSVINKEGWFFEMKIPLYNLRYQIAGDGSVQMAISVTRWSSYNNELQHSVQIPQGIAAGFLKPSLKQAIRFPSLKRYKMLLLTPYIAASTRTENLYNEQQEKLSRDRMQQLSAGLDAKIGLSQYLTLDATINPDFGQAEADVQQVNLSRFSLYFPERRLFFQEQSGLFDFSLGNNAQLFYSRRIGLSDDGVIPLYGGLRLTGQLNSSTDIGVLTMQSRQKRFSDSVHAPRENYGVVRLRRKVMNDKSFVGMLFTNRLSPQQSNYAAGVDAVLNVSRNNYLKIDVAGSYTRNRNSRASMGLNASRVALSWENLDQKGWIPKFGYTYSGKDFDPQLGFLDRSNFHSGQAELAYGVFPKTNKQRFTYQKFTWLKTAIYKNAKSGKTETFTAGMQWRSYTLKAASLSADANYQYEALTDSLDFGNKIVVAPGHYRFPSFSFLLIPSNSKKISFPVGIGAGGFFGGRKYFFSFGPDLNSAQKIHILPGYDFTLLHFPGSSTNKSVQIHIARLKVTYAPDLHFSGSANLQYNSAEKKVFSNIRLRYNFTDGHDLYVVWNNNSRTQRLINGSKAPLTEQQQLLIKYYYTFKFTGPGRK